MDDKSLHTLELGRVLERLARHASFSAGSERILAMRPAVDRTAAVHWQAETTQARLLFERHSGISLGGARDIRPAAEDAVRGITLLPETLLAIRATLQSARALERMLTRFAEEAPDLARIAARLDEAPGLIDAISRTFNEDGEILDSASPALGVLRAEVRTAHERLLTRLNRILSEHAAHLQEPIITQRAGRYVIPLRAEFKGKLPGIVHDQSSSGATLFIEPLSAVETGNRWRAAVLQEGEEIHRILAELSALVAAHHDTLVATVEALADLDAALARALYAEELEAVAPELVDFPSSPTSEFSPLLLYSARHPLLDPTSVVPIDIALRPGVRALVITGPNTGGKTVALKTAGLLTLMAQCGMHIPAGEGSHIAFFDSIFADIGDEQSIEQSLSTFSAHIGQITRILAGATPRSLVILDELGSGTDPQEGSGLARAILAWLLRREISTLVATHYPELKAFANDTAGAENASMEFNLRTLRPTYRLVLGLPGRSNALAIAGRLGLAEEILAEARAMVSDADQHADRLLEKIQRDRDAVRRERADAEKLTRRAHERERDLARRLERIDEERRRLVEETRTQAEAELDGLREELRALRRRASSAAGPELQRIEADARERTEQAVRQVPIPAGAPPAAPQRPPRVGDSIRMRGLGLTGQITACENGEYTVQLGALRLRAQRSDFLLMDEPSAPPADQPAKKPVQASIPRPAERASPGMELDLRGKMVEEGLIELERYLDSAFLSGLPWVRIIHGKGSGKLRAAVRDALRTSPQVASVETGGEQEGGDGVTIARLAV
jgi:DNA mismatch repair protein MutS2